MISRRPERLLRAVHESVALQESGSELTSVAPASAKGHVVPQGLIGHLGPYWSPGTMMHLSPYRSKWHTLLSNALVTSRPGLQLGAMSVTMALLPPGSALMSVFPVAMRAMRIPGVWVTTWGSVGV